MISIHGNAAVATTADEYEALKCLPASQHGWFDHASQRGYVFFPSLAVASAARRLCEVGYEFEELPYDHA